MLAFNIVLGASVGLASLAQASPLSDPASAPVLTEAELFAGSGYTVSDLEWDVKAFPDGPTITLNGTVEQVYSGLLELNSNCDADFGVADFEAPVLERRFTDFTGSSYFCKGRWPQTRTGDVSNGMKYLYKVQGRPRNGAGPGNCGRVSCSGGNPQGAGIWWCNDDNKPKELMSFGSIADGCLYLMNRCVEYDTTSYISGQVFHKTNWNVIIANAYS
ncbi:hypothetical protein CSOJ01_14091 [Colletotrichum sojae]|uniref:Secreted protein n=1 Tax=Colletotrichum sojae TaxID=2175907 RepID=A0A8H6IRD2_9PEZI|nr:hypothetical protein CSOJ01_14091 [Colletotrichum sojae]